MIRKALNQTIGSLMVLAPESPAPLLQAAVLEIKRNRKPIMKWRGFCESTRDLVWG